MTDRPVPVVLLVDDDPNVRQTLARVLDREGSFRVETAADGRHGLDLARAVCPDLIVSDYAMPGLDGFELCRAVRGDPAICDTTFVMITGFGDSRLKIEALNLGVDDFLQKPVDAAELLAKLRATARLRQLHERLRTEANELVRLHLELGRSCEQLLQMLVHLMDLALPGAADRGRRLAETALRLAARFEVPAEFLGDLELAARLHEIGLLTDPDRGRARGPAGRDWRYTVASRAVLSDVERLRTVAELVEAIYENWDGSGFPGHRQRGQIPLRARLLRVLIDFFAELDRAGGMEPLAALARVSGHAGTRYDPAIVGQLEVLLAEEPGATGARTRVHVPIDELADGMVLAEDLYTASGVKLLAAGSTVGRGSIEVIRRRHQLDPVVAGPWVLAATPG